MKRIALFAGLAVLTSCAPAKVAAPEKTEAPALEAEAPPPAQNMIPDYSTAMDRLKPLAKIDGALRPLRFPINEKGDQRYAEAIAYAQETESYNLLIWKDGEIAVEKHFAPRTSDLRPESASMHKSVLALVAAAAIADGDIANVDVELRSFFPEWENDPRGDITLKQALNMSTGLAPLSSDGGMNSPLFQFMGGDNVKAREVALGVPLKDEPDTVFHYTGVNSQLVLMAIENATGMSYQKYLSERLWKPLGADDAYVWLYSQDGPARSHTALLAKAEDWLRIGLLIKDRGKFEDKQIIPASVMDAATAPSKNNRNYGWQIWLGNEYQNKRYYNDAKAGLVIMASAPFLVDDMIYFDGFGGQRVYISRSEDLIIVRQGALRMDWDDATLPNLVIKAGRQ